MNDYVDLTAFDAKLNAACFLFALLAIGLASLCAIAFLCKIRRVPALRRARVFWSDEEGASYSFSFVLILPFYVFLMCYVLEIMFLMVAKLGVVHATQAAARAAAVHVAVVNSEDRGEAWIPQAAHEAAKKAAVVSMVPFASALDPDYRVVSSEAGAYYRAYKDFIKDQKAPAQKLFKLKNLSDPVTEGCVEWRYSSAEGRISVALTIDPVVDKTLPKNEPWRKCVKCDLTYKAPFRLPLVGRALGGKRDGSAVVRTFRASASAQVECPKNKTGFLGVAIPWDVN